MSGNLKNTGTARQPAVDEVSGALNKGAKNRGENGRLTTRVYGVFL